MATATELKSRKAAIKAADPNATWRLHTSPTMQEAVDFASVDPKQGAGEFFAVFDPAGGVAGCYFF